MAWIVCCPAGWVVCSANASVFGLVAAILPGVDISEGIGMLLRPILYLLSCGFIIITLGLIIPVLNALLLLLADELAGKSFEMGIINAVLHRLIKDGDKWYVIRA